MAPLDRPYYLPYLSCSEGWKSRGSVVSWSATGSNPLGTFSASHNPLGTFSASRPGTTSPQAMCCSLSGSLDVPGQGCYEGGEVASALKLAY